MFKWKENIIIAGALTTLFVVVLYLLGLPKETLQFLGVLIFIQAIAAASIFDYSRSTFVG